MDPSTLTFYTIAAGLSFTLCLILLAFAQIQRNTLVIRSSALAILMLAVAFFGAGYGYFLPRWTTVIGTNMMLLSAGAIFYTGFSAYAQQRGANVDKLGWAVVALTAIPFGYWGLIEPDGIYRSIVFSFVAAFLNGRNAHMLMKSVMRNAGGLPTRALATVFTILTVWMAIRGIALLNADPLPVAQRGANPTLWISVFWFNILIAVMTACILAMEISRLRANFVVADKANAADQTSLEPARGNLILLWSMVAVLCAAIVGEVGVGYSALYEREYKQLRERATLANDVFAEHTIQVVNQVDILVRTARGHFEQTKSAEITERFLMHLDFPRHTIENIYLIDADGLILTPWAERAKGRTAAQRDYFLFHKNNPADELFIGPVLTGQVTGKKQFRLSRRIDRADGTFAGIVLAPVEPKAFSSYYRQLLETKESIVALVGIDDRKIRARIPDADPGQWDAQLESPLWDLLKKSPAGQYRNTSSIDQIERQFIYKRVGNLPLVMVTGFSAADVRRGALQSIQPIGLGAALAIIVVLALATILSVVIRRRDEQENFISMLNHELKTPLSVIRMTLDNDGALNEEQQRIARAVRDMTSIIERCVQADRISHGLVAPRRSGIRIASLLATIRDTSPSPERLRIDADELPDCASDAQLLTVVLHNLIDNALKYGKPNMPVQIVAASAAHRGKAGIRIDVLNPPGAAGIPDAKLVFRKYYRAPGAHGKTGSGLGLYIAAGLAGKLGGELRYQASADTVKFELWIPL